MLSRDQIKKLASVNSLFLWENLFERTEFLPKDLNFCSGDIFNSEKYSFQVNFMNLSNPKNGENWTFLRTFQFLPNVRDCTLFLEDMGLEIFTKRSLKKSLPHPKNMTKKSLPCMQLLQKSLCPVC